MYHTLVSAVYVLSILAIKAATAAPVTPVVPNTVVSILSFKTGRFIMFSDEGQISANGDYGKSSIPNIVTGQ